MNKDTYSGMPKHRHVTSPDIIDLRSDTVTRPSAAMREIMAAAEVGDDVYGEDPTVSALEKQTAKLLEKEAGLFVSSGTQGNLIAMLAHCQRGEEYISGVNYHTICDEAGGAAALGGIVPCPIAVDEHHALSISSVEAAIKPDDPHYPVTKLLCLENTVSGKVQATTHIKALSEIAHGRDLTVHMDGARLLNAAVALEQPAATLVSMVDTVSLCLSKGLGAPVGSVLLGPADFIKKALRLRKLLGGGTRQAGVLAACGQYALDHNITRLLEDHENAKTLGEGLQKIPQLSTHYETNMVFVTAPDTCISPLVNFLAERNILIAEQRPEIRLVTHLDVSHQQIVSVIAAVSDYFSQQ